MSAAADILRSVAIPIAQVAIAKAAGALEDHEREAIAVRAVDLLLQTGIPRDRIFELVTERGAAAAEVAVAIAQDLAYGPRSSST